MFGSLLLLPGDFTVSDDSPRVPGSLGDVSPARCSLNRLLFLALKI